MKLIDLLKQSDRGFRRNLLLFSLSYFLVLLNYPLVRASSTTLFFETFGARNSPQAWLWAVLLLSVTVYLCNRLQASFSAQKVMLLVSIISTGLFLLTGLGASALFYPAFVWKEIYIVVQVHLMLAYANNYFKREDFRLLLGPLGAIGSLGGIAGGILTSYVSAQQGTLLVMAVGSIAVLIPAVLFMATPEVITRQEKEQRQESPLGALRTQSIRSYVAHIGVIVALTQFVINILDFQFNLALEANIQTSGERTSYLGEVYTVTNGLTFIFQILILPLLLPRVSQRRWHLFIPLSYLILVLALSLVQPGMLWPIAGAYIYLKASDYSLFSAGKELFYQPLEPLQKYGAKYLTDMITYRTAKAMIAAVLIYLQSSTMLNILMIIFLSVWLIMVIRLFRLQRKLYL
jgi:ATP:ADP antiporter, AAA family